MQLNNKLQTRHIAVIFTAVLRKFIHIKSIYSAVFMAIFMTSLTYNFTPVIYKHTILNYLQEYHIYAYTYAL